MKRIILLLLLLVSGCQNYQIYDVHEQIQYINDTGKFLEAINKAEIDKIILLGSPEATYIYKEGFNNHHLNNQEIMKIYNKYPNRFIPFPTIDPRDTNELKKFKEYLEQGAKGLRLFSGQYAWFYKHIGPVNRSELNPVFQYCQDNNIPIMFNINPPKENIQAEFEDVLTKYPNLKIVCPHFCLSSIKSSRLEYLMDTYPNLYTDISFGHYFEDGLKRISKDTNKFYSIMNKYQNRILFGTDMVITEKTGDSSGWIYNLTMCYRDMLEKEKYNCTVKIKNVFNVDLKDLNGLKLNQNLLKKIYQDNPKTYLNL